MTTIELVKSMGVGSREPSWLMVLTILQSKRNLTIVETGTMRAPKINLGDGGSTFILAHLAHLTRSFFYTVDENPRCADIARKFLRSHGLDARFVTSDSVSFLSRFQQHIDFLYLDSLDFREDRPLDCQCHQLAELGAAYGKLTSAALVLVDDAVQAGGGKSRLLVHFLKLRGWKILYDGHQQLFSRCQP